MLLIINKDSKIKIIESQYLKVINLSLLKDKTVKVLI